MTEKSMRYECVLSRGDEKIATGTMTIVSVMKQPDGTMKAVPIPPDIAARFAVIPQA